MIRDGFFYAAAKYIHSFVLQGLICKFPKRMFVHTVFHIMEKE